MSNDRLAEVEQLEAQLEQANTGFDDVSKYHRTVRTVLDDPEIILQDVQESIEEEEEDTEVKSIQSAVNRGDFHPEAFIQNYTLNALQETQLAESVGATEDGSFLRVGKQALMGVPDALVGLVQDAHNIGNSMGGVVDTINGWFGDKYVIDFNPADGEDGLINLDLRFLEDNKPKSTSEEFARAATRFLTTFIPVNRALKAGLATKAGYSTIVAGGTAGFLSDMAMAEGSEGGPAITEFLASLPDDQQNLIKQYLEAGEDSELIRRIQHGFEGLLVGSATGIALNQTAEVLTKAFQIFKKQKQVPKEAFTKFLNEGEEALAQGEQLVVDNVKQPAKTSGIERIPKNYSPEKGKVAADKYLSGEAESVDLDQILRGVNLKYITDDGELGKLFGTINETLEPKKTVTWTETKAMAEASGFNIGKLTRLRHDVKKLHSNVLAARVMMKQGFDELLEMSSKFVNGDPSTQEYLEFLHLVTVQRSITEMVGDIGSGLGRAFNAMKIPASAYKKGLLYGEAGEEVIRNMGGKRSARALAEELQRMRDLPDNFAQMNKLVQKPKWKKWHDAGRELYTMSLLSAPYTQVANTLSNVGMHLLRNTEGLMIAGADAARKGGRKNSIEWQAFAADLAGQWEGVKDALSLSVRQTDGWRNAKLAIKEGKFKDAANHLSEGLKSVPEKEGGFWKAAINGISDVDPIVKEEARRYALSARELGKENSVSGHLIDVVGSTLRLFSTKPMMGVDEVFKTSKYRGALYAKAVREGVDMGMDIEKIRKVVSDSSKFSAEEVAKMSEKQVMKHYYKTVVDDAYNSLTVQEHNELMKLARESVFQGRLEGKIGDALEAAKDIPFMWSIVPFVRTPTNIVSELIERTPGLNFMKPSVQAAWKRGGRDRAEVIAKMATGFSLYGIGLNLAANGVITGAAPENPRARKMWLDAGNVPFSIKLGDKVITYDRADPVGMFFGMSATAHQIVMNTHNESDQWNVAGVCAGSFTNVLFSKTYLKGLLDVIEILRDPDENAADAGAQILSGFMPNFISAVNREFGDEFRRETKVYQGGMEYLFKTASRIPWMSDSIPVKRDYFGKPVMNEQDGLYGLFDPFTREFKIDKTKQELWRLGVNGLDVKRKVGDYSLTAWEIDELKDIKANLRVRGKTHREAVEAYMQKPNYDSISEGIDGLPGQKQEELKYLDLEYRDKAFDIFRKKHPHIQQAQDQWRLKKIMALKRKNPY